MGLSVPPEFPHHPAPGPVDAVGDGTAPRGRPRRGPSPLVAAAGVLVLMAVALWAVAGALTSDVDPVTVVEPAVLEDGTGQEPGGLVAPRRGPPEDASWSRERIGAAFATAFDAAASTAAWSAAVDAPPALHDRLLALGGRCGSVVATVDAVEFTSPDDAVVRFRLVGSSVPGGDRTAIDGGAARRDGTWKVTGFTVEAVVAAAEATCP